MAKSGRRNKIGVFDVVNTIVMLFLIFITLYPFYHIVCASFSNSTLLSAHKGLLVRPLGFNIGAYKLTFKHPLIWSGYRNILIIMAVALPYQLFMTLLCGYFMSCKGMMFKKPIMALIMFTMFWAGKQFLSSEAILGFPSSCSFRNSGKVWAIRQSISLRRLRRFLPVCTRRRKSTGPTTCTSCSGSFRG